MWIKDKVYQYIAVTGFCLLGLATLVGLDQLTYDKIHFALQIEQNIHDLELEAENDIKEGDWISQIRSVKSSGRILSNDLVNQIEKLSLRPFTIYVYHKDSLIFWSKPGLIVDPSNKEFANIPGVFGDHRQDFYIKHTEFSDKQDLLDVYYKIPIIPEQEQAYNISVREYKFGYPSPDNSTLIRSIDGSPIAHVQLLTKEYSFLLQFCIFILCLVALWSICMTWITWIQNMPDQKVSHVNKILLQMFGVLGLRMATLFLPYHDFFDQISLLSPIIQDISFPYSTTDLLLDSSIFLWLCTLGSKIYSRDLLANVASIPTSKKRWVDRMMTTSHYLVVIMMCGLTAWILRQVVGQSNFRLDLGEISLFDIHHFLSIVACGLIIMGVFTFSFQIVNRAIYYTKNFYERMMALLFAGVISLPLLHLIDINLPPVGFYLGVFILMTLLDLYIEQGNKSVIWVLSWLVTISSLTALVLYKYQKDFEKITRTELIEEAPVGYGQKENPEEDLIEWLRNLPNKYSLGIYRDGQLVFNYRYDYSLVLPESLSKKEKGTFYEITTGDDRTDIALRGFDGNDVLIGKKVEGLHQIVSLFSLIFTVFSFLLFIIAGLNAWFEFLPQNMELTISPRPSLRNKIQIAIVFIIILTFIIVGLLTVYYIRSNSKADEMSRYDERLRTIAGSIRQSIAAESTSWSKDMSQAAKIALANSPSNQIYDPDGNLIHQQDDKYGNESHIPVKLSFLPKMILDAGSRDYYLSGAHPDDEGEVSRLGDVGYVSIHKNGKQSGYIELTELLPSGSEGGDLGSAFFMTLLNAYVLIFLIAICMAVLMARSITGPVGQLSEKLKKIRLGKKNETIQWSIDDEVGELIRDYNGMVTKLDESALLLAQTERDTAWREMAKQVAHEIKNPLTPMKLSIQYLQNAATGDNDVNLPAMIKRVSKTLIEQIDNLTHIASEFSSYAKMPQAMNEVFVINDVVASVHDLFRKREDMDIQLQVPINDLFVFADKSQIIRVLNNVVKNAIQSIPKSRRGIINIKLVFTDDLIIISIHDNGTGIDDHMKDKVFYPNFTTKSSGMGLGLAICSDIITSFDGRIYFETEKGEGTTFFIELPRHIMNGELEKSNQRKSDMVP